MMTTFWIGWIIVGLSGGIGSAYVEYKRNRKLDIADIATCSVISCFGYINILTFPHYLWIREEIKENRFVRLIDNILSFEIFRKRAK